MLSSVKQFMERQQRMEKFLVEILGNGCHELPGLLTGNPPVAVRIDDFRMKGFDDFYEIEILPKDIGEDIPIDWIADHVAAKTGAVAKYHMRDATEDEFQALKASIARHGVRHPIHLDANGKIIDGRLRKRACDELGINCPSIVVGHIDFIEKQQLALELDLCRKHLLISDRKQLAQNRLRKETWISDRQIGRETGLDHKTVATIRNEMVERGEIPHVNQRHGKDGKRYSLSTIRATSKKEIEKAKELYKSLGKETPKREIELRQGKRMIRNNRKKKAGESLMPVATVLDADIQLLHQDFRTLELPDNSVDVIFTDPPYLKEFVPLYGDLSEFAARVLKPGGLLLAYTGVMFLDKVFRLLSDHLQYHWEHVLIHTNCDQITLRKVFGGHKSILCYSKGDCTPLDYVRDVFYGTGPQKDLHVWQQNVDEPLYYLEKLTKPGDLIVDCFGGSFTTAEAVLRLGGRKFIGCDIDPGCVALGQQRIDKVRAEMAMKTEESRRDDENKEATE
jgi:ParB-like chromosome segregation protein Spo0J